MRDSGTVIEYNLSFIDPAVRILNEVLDEEGIELDDDERAAVVKIFRIELNKSKSDVANLISAFKKG